jgi:hypothetical protein
VMLVTHDHGLSARTERTLHLLDGRLHRDEANGTGRRERAARRGAMPPTPCSLLPTPNVLTRPTYYRARAPLTTGQRE